MVLSHDVFNYNLAVCASILEQLLAVISPTRQSSAKYPYRQCWCVHYQVTSLTHRVNYLPECVFFLLPCSQDHNQVETLEDVCNFPQSGKGKWSQGQGKTKTRLICSYLLLLAIFGHMVITLNLVKHKQVALEIESNIWSCKNLATCL